MSFSTQPGPTLGSWLISPTRISLVPTLTAFSKAFIRKMSTMDISSMMITSASSGFSSFRSKEAVLRSSEGTPDSSRSRWIVTASQPVASVIRLAARPVGAARRISMSSVSKYRIMALIVVVLPVPGPPVMTSTPFFTASTTAFRCISSRVIDACFSTLESFFTIWLSSISHSRFRSCSILATFSSI